MPLRKKKETENPEGGVFVSHLKLGKLAIRSKALFSKPDNRLCLHFVQKILQAAEVHQIEIYPVHARAIVNYDKARSNESNIVKKISYALRNSSRKVSMKQPLFLRQVGFHAIRIVRYGKVLSTWEVVHSMPQRLHLRHPLLGQVRSLASRIEQEMAGVYGIDEIKSDFTASSLIVRYDRSRIALSEILLWLEEFIMAAWGNRIESEGQDFSLALKTVSLGIATFTQFAFPALKPVSAAFMLSSNLDTITGALKQIYEKKIEKEALDWILVFLALLTDSYFSGALMIWLQEVWPKLFAKMGHHYHKKLLIAPRQFPLTTEVLTNGKLNKTFITSIDADSTVCVRAGMVLPIDGLVLEGTAIVDESSIFGPSELREKKRGDRVFASSSILDGQLFVRIVHRKSETVAAKISSTVSGAAGSELPSVSDTAFLIKNIAPAVLIAGGIGFILGGPQAAQAIMRPDYLTGPVHVPQLSLLQALVNLTRKGIIIRRGDALENLLRVDTIVVSGDVGIDREKFQQYTKNKQVSDVIYVDAGDASKNALIESLRKQGKKVAYLSSCGADGDIFKQADIGICFDGLSSLDHDGAHIFFMNPSIDHVTRLFDEAKEHSKRIAAGYRYTIIPNFFGSSGALLANFPPIFNVILSNLGILAIYGSALHGFRHCDPAVAGRK
jgi:Cu2+-exporting ATPase